MVYWIKFFDDTATSTLYAATGRTAGLKSEIPASAVHLRRDLSQQVFHKKLFGKAKERSANYGRDTPGTPSLRSITKALKKLALPRGLEPLFSP
jgi:hypothetical protein